MRKKESEKATRELPSGRRTADFTSIALGNFFFG